MNLSRGSGGAVRRMIGRPSRGGYGAGRRIGVRPAVDGAGAGAGRRIAAGPGVRAVLATMVVGALAVAACSAGGSTPSSAASSAGASIDLGNFGSPQASSGVQGGGANEPKGGPTGKIRIANFYAPNGQPGGAFDFYDTSKPAASDKPLIANLAYGQVSDYVTPRAADAGSGSYSQLYVFPAGSQAVGAPTAGGQAGMNISNAGWQAGQQQTIVMSTGDSGGNGTVSASWAAINEAGNPSGQPVLVTPSPGGGLLVTNVSGIDSTDRERVDLRIDGTCPNNIDPTTGSPAQMGNVNTGPALLGNSNASNFPLAVGSHKLEVVLTSAPGQGLSQAQCQAAAAVATVTVSLAASPAVEVFIYGPTLQDVKMVTAPLQ